MENLPLEIYDIIMLVVLVLMTIAGAYWGLAWQVASLASLGLSWVVAMRFGPQVAPIFAGDKEPTFWHNCTAILVIYLGTSLAIWIVFRLISKIIARVKLKEFDRQTGAMLGLANGVALCLVITFFAVTLSEQARQAVLRSRSGYYAAVIVERVSPAIPEDVRKVLGKYIEELDRKLDPDTPAEESVLDESISASIQLPRDQTPTGAGAPPMSPRQSPRRRWRLSRPFPARFRPCANRRKRSARIFRRRTIWRSRFRCSRRIPSSNFPRSRPRRWKLYARNSRSKSSEEGRPISVDPNRSIFANHLFSRVCQRPDRT